LGAAKDVAQGVGRDEGGAIRHEELPAFFLDLARWSHAVVGRYLHPTLEKWELGFMRDMHADREILLWHRLAFAYITYYSRKGRLPRDDAEAKKTVGLLVAAAADGGVRHPEATLLRECLESPDGWQEEIGKVMALAKEGAEHWTPTAHFPDWPAA
jgi:hypothetical protein